MSLKSLELLGFKSFAKKTALEFTTPITAIVGPNGSGKSNIAEAFRFVLGEQSIKSMRGKRTEDLIWNGSPELGRSNRASVRLIFDNRKKLLNIDFDEVALERVIYRDASSEYSLNSSLVRLRDIVEVLSGAHIGASGHHIISQGEADRILSATMKERREMIEDALGLKVYQWKREESARKLEKTEENMKQVEGLRKEIAPHMAFLKKQVEKVEKVKLQKEELRSLYGEYLKQEHQYLFSEKKRIEKEEHAPKEGLSRFEREIEQAKRVLTKTAGKDGKSAAIIAVEEKLNRLRTERENLTRELGRLEGEISGRERLTRFKEEGSGVLVPLSEIEEVSRLAEHAFAAAEKDDGGSIRSAFQRIVERLQSLLSRYRSKSNPATAEFGKELALLVSQRRELEKKLEQARIAEHEAVTEERSLRVSIEKERDSNRDAEREVLRIAAGQSELRGILAALAVRRQEIAHREQDFRRELTEGAILVGREILNYGPAEVVGETDTALGARATVLTGQEERAVQEERRRRIERLKIRIEDAGAGGGSEILKEFGEIMERDQFLARELADLRKGAETLRHLIAELEQKLDDEFRFGIGKINDEFQKFFSLMFGGGSARLSVVKRERVRREVSDVFTEDGAASTAFEGEEKEEEETGIEIEVSLPRKKIKGLMMLSGGERALTSIALIFAMSQVKPPPFIILDETDAALDEANSKKYGDMVENLSKRSQLILITHNRETMSRAGVLYGVTMDRSGVSKLLSVAFDEAVSVAN